VLARKGVYVNPKNLKYHREHDWARIEGDTAVFGLTSYAQETLGDIVYIELPEVGADVTAGTAYAEVESVKAVSDVYAPLSGSVVEVNDEVVDAPELINESPFEDGWLIKIKLSDPSEAEDLMSAEEYEELTSEEE
jgi:glycine cleavage system H protein